MKSSGFGGRAQQIHEEMKADFNRYMTEIHPTRMQAILKAGGHVDEGPADMTAIAAANTFSVAEGLLAAVAMYLARQEASTETE